MESQAKASLPLTVEVITDFSKLEKMREGWQQLWLTDSKAEIFQHFEWVRSWWKGYGSKLRLCTLTAVRGTELIGILPLVLRGRTLESLGWPCSDYNDVICREEDTATVLAAMLKALSDLQVSWDMCRLDNVPQDSRLMRHWAAIGRAARLDQLIMPASNCPTILLQHNRDEVFAPLLRKQHYRRHQNKLERQGSLVFRHIEDQSNALKHLRNFVEQQLLRRALSDQKSVMADNEFRDYVESLFSNLDLKREVRFSVLELDGKPLAYHLGFQLNHKFLMYQQSFDVDAWELAPGDVLVLKLLTYAAVQDIEEYDFSRGEARYKSSFANHIKTNSTICLFPRTPLGLARFEMLRARTFLASKQSLRTVRETMTKFLGPLPELWSNFRNDPKELARSITRAAADHLYHRDFSYIFPGDFRNFLHQQQDEDPVLSACSAKLSELAALSYSHPKLLPPDTLRRLRERLRGGEQICLVFGESGLVHMCAVKKDTMWDAPSGTHTIDTSRCNLVEELWTATAFRRPAWYLRCLSAALQATGLLDDATATVCQTNLELAPALRGRARSTFHYVEAAKLLSRPILSHTYTHAVASDSAARHAASTLSA